MGVLDKIKNALFEVEYVEVEEPVKKEKKIKGKEKDKTKVETVNNPVAKKVVLPEKKLEKSEEIRENKFDEEVFDEKDPVEEDDIVQSSEEFKFMDDKDFKVDDDEPEILDFTFPDDKLDTRSESRMKSRYNREEFYDDFQEKDESYSTESLNEKYNSQTSTSLSSKTSNKPYGIDNSYEVPMYEYGSYEKKEERCYFKPSPIISPIYGILDKNYKKEDVVSRKDIRLGTGFSRSRVSVDDIRNKAYGEQEDEEKFNDLDDNKEIELNDYSENDENDDNLLVDLSDDKDKPEVKKLTVGDALEYFQDLGLEYNVDYVDASKERTTPKREKDNYEVFEQENANKEEDKPIIEFTNDISEENLKKASIKIENESDNFDDSIDDDNLFDLIDSMYQENE